MDILIGIVIYIVVAGTAIYTVGGIIRDMDR